MALRAAGLDVLGPWGRNDGEHVREAARSADLVLLAVPDAAIAAVASAIAPRAACVVAHLSGSRTLDVLGPHLRQASLHPLVSMPNPEVGSQRLLDGAWFAIAASDDGAFAELSELVAHLRGRSFEVDDGARAGYHAAACVASNHLVVLLAQVERVAASFGVPREALLDLARHTLDNVGELGAAAALTGPVARGDEDTVFAHLRALPASEHVVYLALARAAHRMAHPDVPMPPWGTGLGEQQD